MIEISPEELRKQFLGWQCRVRQHVVRKEEGRPSPGMQPSIIIDGKNAGSLVVLITKDQPAEVTQEFRHIVLKTQDPEARYKSAIKLLSEYYYQYPAEFSDEMTAIFSVEDETADKLVEKGEVNLSFNQAGMFYDLPCTVEKLDEQSERYQATYWHNYLFNPRMPGRVSMVCFRPDWSRAEQSQGKR
ncbi:MAG: hypothetical protein AAF402_16800 [Pseudomonadota bacterium]